MAEHAGLMHGPRKTLEQMVSEAARSLSDRVDTIAIEAVIKEMLR